MTDLLFEDTERSRIATWRSVLSIPDLHADRLMQKTIISVVFYTMKNDADEVLTNWDIWVD